MCMTVQFLIFRMLPKMKVVRQRDHGELQRPGGDATKRRIVDHIVQALVEESGALDDMNTKPNEPHQVRNGEVVEDASTTAQHSLTDMLMKDNLRMMESLMRGGEKSKRMIKQDMDKHRDLCLKHMQMIDRANADRYHAVNNAYREEHAEHVAYKERYMAMQQATLNPGTAACPRNVEDCTAEQVSELLQHYEIYKFVLDDDAAGFDNFLATHCVHYKRKELTDSCPCQDLTIIPFQFNDRDWKIYASTPIFHAVANNKHKFLRELGKLALKNDHLESLFSPWVYDYEKLFNEAIFYEHPDEGDSDSKISKSMVLSILMDEKLPYLKFSFLLHKMQPRGRIPAYEVGIKSDYIRAVHIETPLTLLIASDHWPLAAFKISQNRADNSSKWIPQVLFELMHSGNPERTKNFIEIAIVPWLDYAIEKIRFPDPGLALFPMQIPDNLFIGDSYLHAAVRTGNFGMVKVAMEFTKSVYDKMAIKMVLDEMRNRDHLNLMELAIELEYEDIVSELEKYFEERTRYEYLRQYTALMNSTSNLERLVTDYRNGRSPFKDLPLLSSLVSQGKDELAHQLVQIYYEQEEFTASMTDDLNKALAYALYPRVDYVYKVSGDKPWVDDCSRMKNMVAVLLAAGAELPKLDNRVKDYTFIGAKTPRSIKRLLRTVFELNATYGAMNKVLPLNSAYEDLKYEIKNCRDG